MNLIGLKERIAISTEFTPQERDFLLDAVNASSPPEHAETLKSRNYMGRIESIWAYLSVDEGGEGICAAPMAGLSTVPLIAADKTRLDAVRPLARLIASKFSQPVRLVKFTKREDVEIIRP